MDVWQGGLGGCLICGLVLGCYEDKMCAGSVGSFELDTIPLAQSDCGIMYMVDENKGIKWVDECASCM